MGSKKQPLMDSQAPAGKSLREKPHLGDLMCHHCPHLQRGTELVVKIIRGIKLPLEAMFYLSAFRHNVSSPLSGFLHVWLYMCI